MKFISKLVIHRLRTQKKLIINQKKKRMKLSPQVKPINFRLKPILKNIVQFVTILLLIISLPVSAKGFSLTLKSTETNLALVEKEIKGKVVDGNGNPIPGANITAKGAIVSTQTDIDGRFSLNVPEDVTQIVVSFIGMESQEVSVGKAPLTIVMKESGQKLEEVVVVAYGNQKKVNLSGAVNTVNNKILVNRPVATLTNALQGAIPGLNIVSAPADIDKTQGSLSIRGKGSLGASAPLYVLDGAIVTAADFNRINPHDVESISILKDASASAIYGSRAAYGVILVTTKMGKSGKMVVNFNTSVSDQTPIYKSSYLGSYDYAILFNEANTNAGKAIRFTAANLQTIKDQSNPDLYPDVDWRSLVYKKSTQMVEHQVNVSGGTDNTRYYISGSFNNQNSLFPGKDLKRYTFRTNIESKISDKFKIGSNISFSRSILNVKNAIPGFKVINKMIPLYVPIQSNGNWGSISGGQIDGTAALLNPLRTLEIGGRSDNNLNSFIGTVTPTYTPIKGLDIAAQVTYSFDNYYESSFANTTDPVLDFFTGLPISGTGNATNSRSETWNSNSNLLAQLTSSFEKKIGNHSARILVGSSIEDNTFRAISVTRKVYVNNSLNSIDAGSTVPTNTTASGYPAQNAFSSVFSRFNYSFMDKYLLETSYRMDKSSKFAPGATRNGKFPSFSVAWRISQENFMKKIDWISELKTRFSWGELGNSANVGNYDYNSTLKTSQALLGQGYVGTVNIAKSGNSDLRWESTEMKNLGLDLGLFNNKFTLQLDVYDRLTKGILLVDPSLPDEAGLTGSNRPSTNKAYVDNKGIELSANYNHRVRDVNFSVGGNIFKVWNKVVQMDSAGTDQIYTNSGEDATLINRIGEPVGSFYMYKANGLFKDAADVAASAFQSNATRAGDIKYVDQNGDGKITALDRVVVKGAVPTFVYGLNFSVSYKDFDLSVLGQGVYGTKSYIGQEGSQAFFNGAGAKEYQLDRWTTANPNPNASYPRVLQTPDNGQNVLGSSFWLFNTSYFRIKGITIGYSIPESILSKINVQKIKIYVSSNNPLTFGGDKRIKDIDPENGNANNIYPQLKSVAFGMNISL